MQTVSVNTLEYEIDVAALLKRRLLQVKGGAAVAAVSGKDVRTAQISLRSEEEREALCQALGLVLLKDAANFELARMVEHMPLPLGEKQQVLAEAVHVAHQAAEESGADGADPATDVRHVGRLLREHFDRNDHLNLEGFFRFRMQDTLRAFEIYALCAVEELLLQREYMELLHMLSGLVRMQQPRLREVSLILHADGSCTITDDTDARIECEGCGAAAGAENEVINLLVALAPARIVVYDLSCGRWGELSEALLQVFEDRVSFFR